MEDLRKYLAAFQVNEEIKQLTEQSKFNEYMIKLLSSTNFARSQKNFVLTEKMIPTFNQIFMYLNKNKEVENLKSHCTIQPWKLSKGLFLSGNFGSGKTLLLDVIYSQRDKLKIQGHYTTAYDLSWHFTNDKTKFEQLTSGEKSLFLDEVGDEPKETINFGNAENTTYRAMKLFFDKVEKKHEKPLLFATSNLGQEEIIQRYDHRIWSRIVGNCNIVPFGLEMKDFRKS